MMKMRVKKAIALLLAVLFTMAMGMTALAADSPSASGVITGATGKDAAGREAEIIISSTDMAAPTEAQLREILKGDFVEGMKVAALVDVSVKNGDQLEWPVTITFQVPGVTEDSQVAVIHYTSGAWENVTPVTLGDGTVTASFDSLSPVGIVMKDVPGTAGDEAVSPKTGENSAAMLAGGIAVLALAAAYVLRKKAY